MGCLKLSLLGREHLSTSVIVLTNKLNLGHITKGDWESLRRFVNTISAVDKCSLPNRDNLMQPIHMALTQKLKTFSWFFPAFWKSRLNFELFQKKDDAPSLFISEATACKKRG